MRLPEGVFGGRGLTACAASEPSISRRIRASSASACSTLSKPAESGSVGGAFFERLATVSSLATSRPKAKSGRPTGLPALYRAKVLPVITYVLGHPLALWSIVIAVAVGVSAAIVARRL